jgi:hypothetical protein
VQSADSPSSCGLKKYLICRTLLYALGCKMLNRLFDYFCHYKYCDDMPESRNSGIGSEVDFQGNELLRRLHDNS